MKIRTVLITVALATATTLAAAEPPVSQARTRDRALMLYFSKSFGAPAQRAPPLAFGLRLQQSSYFDSSRVYPLIDARYSLTGRRTLAFGGALAYDSSQGTSSEGSSEASSEVASTHPGWTAAAIIVGALGIMCLEEWGICESDNHGGYETPTPTNPTNPG